ncbi:MAG: hypothetical protein FWF81_04980 [Defluviitaleaceae bacterium]|nr:hypothetical protein [Defluviitaleaceae bacterium]
MPDLLHRKTPQPRYLKALSGFIQITAFDGAVFEAAPWLFVTTVFQTIIDAGKPEGKGIPASNLYEGT